MKRGPELHYFRCNRVCKSVTVKAIYSGRYERCRGCGSMAIYLYTVPVETEAQKAIHAQGVVFNPHKFKPVPWACVRCGADKTGTLPEYRSDGKVCLDCYHAEPAPPPLDPNRLAEVEREENERMEQAYRELESNR